MSINTFKTGDRVSWTYRHGKHRVPLTKMGIYNNRRRNFKDRWDGYAFVIFDGNKTHSSVLISELKYFPQ